MPNPLITALEPRARHIAGILAPRIPHPGAWEGYQKNEPLIGTLTEANTIQWRRSSVPPDAVYGTMVFGFLTVRELSGTQTGQDVVISSNVIERHEDLFQLEKPIKYTETLRHTFSRTSTVEEATEQAWKVSAKASFTAKYGGIGGSIEAAAEYGQRLARKTSESVTMSDEITKTIEVQGPVTIRWIAERSTDTIARHWNVVPDLDFKLYYRSGDSGWEWSSFRDVFIPAAKGEAPVDPSYSIFAGSSDSHDLFEQHPVPDPDIEELSEPTALVIPFTAEYQTVNRQSIKAL